MSAKVNNDYQEASDMLAEALKQMDGILAGTVRPNYGHQNGVLENSGSTKLSSSSPKLQHSRAVKLLNDLRVTLEGVEDKQRVLRQLSPDTQTYLGQWLGAGIPDHQGNIPHTNGFGCHGGSTENLVEKVRRLETDKDNLGLQVSVLTDQIEAQVEKIRDLEIAARPARNGGIIPDQELLSRSAESDAHKLDLMADNSNLRLKLAACEREKQEMEERLSYAQKRVDDMQSRLNQNIIEMTELRSRVSRTGSMPSSPTAQSDSSRERTMERERTLDRLKRKHTEVEKLKQAVDTLMATNSQKDHHIEELKKLIRRYKRIEDMVLSAQGKKGLENINLNLSFEDDHSDSSSTQNSNTSDPTARNPQQPVTTDLQDGAEERLRPRLPFPNATSTPVNSGQFSSRAQSQTNHLANGSPTMTPVVGNPHSPSTRRSVGRSNSFETPKPGKARTPPTVRRQDQGFGTLPKDVKLNSESSPPSQDGSSNSTGRPRATTLPKGSRKPPIAPPHGSSPKVPAKRDRHKPKSSTLPRKPRAFVSFGKGFFKLGRSGKWSSSAPDLAQTENDEEALKDEMAQQYKALQSNQNKGQELQRKKSKGFKRLFGKLKRTNSQEMDEDKLEAFKRAGLRSTAGPRLGWSKDLKYGDIDVPFERWDTDQICLWLHSMGLSMYVGDAKRWVKNGDQMLKASSHDLEKELGLKNHFHRKKLHLALKATSSESKCPCKNLDHNWVTRWLDDIGLPQYKDVFSEARIDGNMLNFLTVEELVNLRVTNTLHHLSIKRAIQVLRLNNFNPACLRRRPSPEEGQLQNCPAEVSLWTNHRVMEWLRSIDLSEYAPNLRGSGVHGALMVLESRFSADIFATLLSIPPIKTLLRRHLSTHFVALIGNDTQTKKREFETQQGFMPLTPNQKVKLKKKLFAHKRTKSDDEDFVCPLDSGTLRENQTNGHPTWSRDASPSRNKEKMLAKDKFLENVPTSDV